MGLFKNKNANIQLSESQLLNNKFTNARHNIIWVVVLTVINIILSVTNSNSYFLFSAYVPYMIVDLGMLLCGRYPEEIYAEDFAGMEFLPDLVFVITLVIAAVILALYVLSFIFSKKPRVGWLIFALVFFSIDTLAMILLNGIVLESIIDYVIHAWVIISFVSGISAYFKLKKIPEVIEVDEIQENENIEISPVNEIPTEDISDNSI